MRNKSALIEFNVDDFLDDLLYILDLDLDTDDYNALVANVTENIVDTLEDQAIDRDDI